MDYSVGLHTVCQTNAANSTNHPLVFEHVDMSIGRKVDDLLANVRNANATFKQRGRVITVTTENENPSQFGSPFVEQHIYIIGSKGGRITGLKGCQNYESGRYRYGLNTGLVRAFGAPERVTGHETSTYMAWPNGATLMISGSPNLARAEVGIDPEPLSSRDENWNLLVFDELVRAEDQVGQEAARTKVALDHCITSDELESIIVPMLQAGIQPKD